MKRWQFRPSPWAAALTFAACGAMTALGVWQWQRGLQKERLGAQYEAAQQLAPMVLGRDSATPVAPQVRSARAEGRWLADRQLLLDNQVRGRIPGYDVWTPLRLADGALVIVNRGWLPQDPDRRVLPDLTIRVESASVDGQIEGLWRALPEPALRLADDACDASVKVQPWPRIVQYPTARDLACLYGEPVLAGELLLAPAAADGYVREWRIGDNGFPPTRHYGYALQWFAFAATLAAIFVKLNLERRP